MSKTVFYSISIPHYCDNPFNTAFPSPQEPAVPPLLTF